MRTYVGISQSVPAEAIWAVAGVMVVVGGAIWLVSQLFAQNESDQSAARSQLADDYARLEENERQLAAAIARRSELVLQAESDWRAELGELATNVRRNHRMLCPHCPAEQCISIADSVSGLTLARCHSCGNSWKF